jgi:putative glycosyltransferase (TIGR04372 family)
MYKFLKYVYYLPGSFLIILIHFFFRYKFFFIDTTRIGHFVNTIPLLNKFCNKKKKCFVFYRSIQSNNYLLSLIKLKFKNVSFKKNFYAETCAGILSNRFKKKFNLRVKYGHLVNKNTTGFEKISTQTKEAKILFSKLGLDINDKWICIANRDDFYLKSFFKNDNFDYHNYRNFNINSFNKAADFFFSQGYKVVRVGSSKNKVKNKNIIDYATSDYRSDLNDLILISNCVFFISSSSGIVDIAKLFGIPHTVINIAPFGDGFTRSKFEFPILLKKYYDMNTHLFLTVSEIFQRKLNNIYYSDDFKKNSIVLKDNTDEEIYNLSVSIAQYLKIKEKYNFISPENNEKYIKLQKILNKTCKVFFNNIIENNQFTNLKI